MAAHELNKAFRDRQAQAGAPKPARRGRLGLRKSVKDTGLILGGNTNTAVTHRNSKRCVRVGERQHLQLDQHFPFFCEFDGIPCKVNEHLL